MEQLCLITLYALVLKYFFYYAAFVFVLVFKHLYFKVLIGTFEAHFKALKPFDSMNFHLTANMTHSLADMVFYFFDANSCYGFLYYNCNKIKLIRQQSFCSEEERHVHVSA